MMQLAELAPLTDTVLSLRVLRLSLTHFRNYKQARLELDGRPVVLTGANGAGKTNILEALSLLTPGRGLRRAKLSDIVNQGKLRAPWAVSALIEGLNGQAQIGTGLDEASPDGDKRLVRIDSKPARSQNELARHLAMLWLTPQMEQLFQEGTSAGRKFLDRLVYSFDPEHLTRINAYDYAMRERNRLLALGGDAAWLDTLEDTMAENAAAIAIARSHTIERINHAVNASSLSFPKAHMAVTGFMEDLMASGMPAVEAEQSLKAALRDSRRVDAAAGRSLTGAHRSVLHVMHTLKSMPAEACSTGEQKAMLLSITLAQARAGAMWHAAVPVILLDEVAAHLDPGRRQELFDEIRRLGAQVWMTGTDRALFGGMEGSAQFMQVEQGMIAP